MVNNVCGCGLGIRQTNLRTKKQEDQELTCPLQKLYEHGCSAGRHREAFDSHAKRLKSFSRRTRRNAKKRKKGKRKSSSSNSSSSSSSSSNSNNRRSGSSDGGGGGGSMRV
ncbi:hypothetical protein V1478_017016 [Vespula squamosa]|uniref:Uncharacterized protein n=1 Tax=Vespula squamosa TaxID=30214 RepID=A0ABD1ZYB5_VESSQ